MASPTQRAEPRLPNIRRENYPPLIFQAETDTEREEKIWQELAALPNDERSNDARKDDIFVKIVPGTDRGHGQVRLVGTGAVAAEYLGLSKRRPSILIPEVEALYLKLAASEMHIQKILQQQALQDRRYEELMAIVRNIQQPSPGVDTTAAGVQTQSSVAERSQEQGMDAANHQVNNNDG